MQAMESMDPVGISPLGSCSKPWVAGSCQNPTRKVRTNGSVYIAEFTSSISSFSAGYILVLSSTVGLGIPILERLKYFSKSLVPGLFPRNTNIVSIIYSEAKPTPRKSRAHKCPCTTEGTVLPLAG